MDNMERLTSGMDGALPIEVLHRSSPEEHRANMYCAVNNQRGGISDDAVQYMKERKVKRGH